jgi:hypothetical protein
MELKHSGFGIASFILSIVTGILVFLAVITAGVMEASTPGGINEESIGAIVLGLVLIALFILDLTALGLGIGGLVQKDRKKVFAVLGTAFSGVTIAGTVLLMIIGSMK